MGGRTESESYVLSTRREVRNVGGALRENPVEVDKEKVKRTTNAYLFTLCEYGGGEKASCKLICDEAFAEGFERGLNLRIDEDKHYIVREELGEEDVADDVAVLDPWTEAA